MLTPKYSRAKERGIVLVLVLAMLGLLALVGITFAAFAQQAKINNRNYMLSVLQPQADELFDFAMQQLIADTNDIRSAIRGHSLARDMYGNDGIATPGATLLTGSSFNNTGNFRITAVTTTPPSPLNPVNAGNGGQYYFLTTNILGTDPNFFSYNFKGWIMRLSYNGTIPGSTPLETSNVTQTFEIFSDGIGQNGTHVFQVCMNGSDGFYNATTGTPGPALYNPTPVLPNNPFGFLTALPGGFLAGVAVGNLQIANNTFVLDCRWMRAFNGAGMGATTNAVTGLPNSYYGNFRYNNSPIVAQNQPSLGVGGPGFAAMDEDYDACDLENWFLAIQSADGQVMIPSFHRPGIIRYDPNNQVNDWARLNQSGPQNAVLWADSAARILRPCQADGNDAATFRDLLPGSNGKINYDVDNDGDGTSDSVWLDLGYPVLRDSSGKLYKPLFSFMVIGLNGRMPLNTAGNLANWDNGVSVPVTVPTMPPTPPAQTAIGGPGHAAHLGTSVSEVDPSYGLQNAYFQGQIPVPPANPQHVYFDPQAAFATPNLGLGIPGGSGAVGGQVPTLPADSQVDNGGVDVRLTQLRNLLAGTRPQPNPNVNPNLNANVASINGDTNFLTINPTANAGPSQYWMPNGIPETSIGIYGGGTTPVGSIDAFYSDPNLGNKVYVLRNTTPVPGRWGEAGSIAGAFLNPAYQMGNGLPQYLNTLQTFLSNGGATTVGQYVNAVRAGYSYDPYDILNGVPRDAADDNSNAFDVWPLGHTGEWGDLDWYDATGSFLLPIERMRRWVTPADINGTGTVSTFNLQSNTANRGADFLGRVEFDSYYRPPGSPGVISSVYQPDAGTANSVSGVTLGAIVYPPLGATAGQNPPPPFFLATPSNYWPAALVNGVPAPSPTPPTTSFTYSQYLPDLTNNPFHGFESYRFPNQNYTPGPPPFYPPLVGGVPVGGTSFGGIPGLNINTYSADLDANNIPIDYPTYDFGVNSSAAAGYAPIPRCSPTP